MFPANDNCSNTTFSNQFDNLTSFGNLTKATNLSEEGNSAYQEAALTFITWFALPVLLAGVVMNGLCLIAFVQEKRLRTVFNCYLICLSATDFLYAAISIPNFIILNYYGFWPLGQNYCAFYLWADWTFSAVAENTVVLIGIDRVWALYWPFSYRRHRSRKVTCAAIAGMWLVELALILPGIVINRLNSTDPLTCEVTMDSPRQRVWGIFVNFMSYITPQIVLLGCFALTAFKIRSQGKIRGSSEFNAPSAGAQTGRNALRLQPITDIQTSRLIKDRCLFRLFGFLTLSMCICWMPGNIFWTMYNIDPGIYNFSFAMTVTLMMFLSCVSNPLLYQMGSTEMRRVLMQILRIEKSDSPTNPKLADLSRDAARLRDERHPSIAGHKETHKCP